MNKKVAVLFLLLSFVVCCVHSTSDVKLSDIVLKTGNIHRRSDFPLDYYAASDTNCFVDGFSDDDIETMQRAADDWSKYTNGIVKVNIHGDWTPPYSFDAELYRDLPFKSVWKFNWNSVEAQTLFHTAFDEYTEFCGMSWGNLIVIIDGNYRCGMFYSTFAHELGHQFGLDHVKPKYFAVMNPKMGRKTISEYDIFLFCYLYECLEETWFLNQKY